jgi:peptide/nickel transport system permease protein
MSRFVVTRLLQTLITAFGLTVLVFFLLRLTGDPSTAILSREASAETRAEFRHQMGFDRPVIVQLVDYLAHVAQGDFGISYKYRLPVLTLLLERLPATVELALAGMALAILVGVPIGMLGAARPGSVWAAIADFLGVASLSSPSFWVGLILIIVFSVTLRIFPVAGRSSPKSLVLPAVTMSLTCLGQLIRITRATMLEVLRQDYIRVAYAKGLPRRTINYRHALRNAAIPIVTLLGINLGYMLGGSVVIETVFAWPGVGRLTFQAVSSRDFILVQAIALFTSWVVLILNLFTDLLYGVLDPRVSYGRKTGG